MICRKKLRQGEHGFGFHYRELHAYHRKVMQRSIACAHTVISVRYGGLQARVAAAMLTAHGMRAEL